MRHAWRRCSAQPDALCAQRPRNGRNASAGGLRACLVIYILQDARGVRWYVPLFLSIWAFVTKYCNAAIITASCSCSFDLPDRKGACPRRLFCLLAPLPTMPSLYSSTKKLASHILEHRTYHHHNRTGGQVLTFPRPGKAPTPGIFPIPWRSHGHPLVFSSALAHPTSSRRSAL